MHVASLQDSWSTLAPALAGLIAHLFEVTLQEDMASTTRRLVQLGHDVINGSRGEDSLGSESVARDECRTTTLMRLATMPALKTLEQFNWSPAGGAPKEQKSESADHRLLPKIAPPPD